METFHLLLALLFFISILVSSIAVLRGRLHNGTPVSVPARGRAVLFLICSIALFLYTAAWVDRDKVDFSTSTSVANSGGLWTGATPVKVSYVKLTERVDRATVPLLAGRGTRRSISRKVHAELFGPIEYGMTLDEIMQVLPKGREVKVEYKDNKSLTLHWFTTMWGEFAKVHLQMMGSGQTLSAVVVVIDNCENPVVKPGGVSLSTACQEVTRRIAQYLEERYGAPRKEREPYAEGDGYLERTIWTSPTSEIYFVFTKSVEQNGAERFEINTAPLLVFEPQK